MGQQSPQSNLGNTPNRGGSRNPDVQEVQDERAEQDPAKPENREAARQGNPISSSYSRENREGAERGRREAADQPGSEYHGEAVAAREGKLTSNPQRGHGGSKKHA
jgi:hypothetical protein